MTGGSITGLQASDLGALYHMAVQESEPADPGTVLISEGTVVPAALHAAFMLQDGLDALVAVDGLVSYADIMYMRDYEARNIPGAVPDVLGAYDLPDLVKAAGMHTLLVRPRRADGRIADKQFLEQSYFEGTFAADRQQLVTKSSAGDEQAVHRTIATWLDGPMMHDD